MEKEESKESLTDKLSKEIVNTSIDTSIDYAELTIDEILTSDTLKEIPIVKTLVSIAKIGINIKERFFVKKLLTFLRELHLQNIDTQKLEDFKGKFENEPKFRTKVTEQIMIYNDAFLNIEKSKILAKLFKSHIEGNFDWEYFNYLSVCLNNAHPKAFKFLEKLSTNNFIIPEEPEEREQLALERDGDSEALLYSCGIAYESSSWSSGFNVSELGKDLYLYGIK